MRFVRPAERLWLPVRAAPRVGSQRSAHVEWLHDVLVATGVERLFARVCMGVSAERNQIRSMRACSASDLAHRGPAVHDRHPEVHQDDVRIQVYDLAHSVYAVCRDVHVVSLIDQQRAQIVPMVDVILDDENMDANPFDAPIHLQPTQPRRRSLGTTKRVLPLATFDSRRSLRDR